MDIIKKDKKDIRWVGSRTNPMQRKDVLEVELVEKVRVVQEKEKKLQVILNLVCCHDDGIVVMLSFSVPNTTPQCPGLRRARHKRYHRLRHHS